MLTDNAYIPPANNLIVDGTAYARNLHNNSILNVADGALNISGTLALNSKIILNNSSLILKGQNSIVNGANPSNYVVTNGTSTAVVENLGSSRGNVNLPIGTASNYNPVTVANSGVADSYAARVSEGIANTDSGAVNTTWEITEGTAGGSNVTLSFGWNQQQEDGSFQRATAKVGHFVNGSWMEENSGSVTGANPFIITATGVSNFSPFAVVNFGSMSSVDLNQTQITLYPNPFFDLLNVKSAENGILQLYDLSGKRVSNEPLQK